MSPGRILVLQLKRIGDLLLTAPALMRLRRHFPEAEIVLLVGDSMRELAGCIGGVDRVLAYQPGRPNVGVWSSLFWGEWDLCLDFSGTDRSAILTRASRARDRIGYRQFSGGWLRGSAYTDLSGASVRESHTLDFHDALVSQAVGHSETPGMVGATPLRLQPAVARSVDELIMRKGLLSQPFVILHPGTARAEKFWPVDRWVETAAHLHRLGMRVVLTGTGTGLEAADVRHLQQQRQVPLVDLTGKLSLPQLAALIQRARLALGVDSMAMHMAALWRVPQVVLFGPTNPFHWRPRHEQGIVLASGDDAPLAHFDPRRAGGVMTAISVRAVTAAADRLLAE